ncbi:MAG: 3'(2'),5'-bisphosphate nucleotidase CysQ [Bacteroidetes bacterium]|nr:3'(2'),5'-bisphosphate nucleotidase CysQ [Bacteroidota bacterium]MBU1717889.1 3'(2'),5'-bisphosphate nucleotidase CysQ [Bacteroidota bacterium]
MDYVLMMNVAGHAAVDAGNAILDVYNSDFGVEEKADHSPLTLADRRAHEIISARLRTSGLPVLSEEGRDIPYDERSIWRMYWLVDPLDGTKEFVKRNGEFTVNIALIIDSFPVAGIVYVPVSDTAYIGLQETGAFRFSDFSKVIEGKNLAELLTPECSIKTGSVDPSIFRVVASRSHLNEETQAFIDKFKKQYFKIEMVSKGSSLKLCMVAEGEADIYPRLAPTMEWDTAAGQAVAEASGAIVTLIDGKSRLRYNKPDLTNPKFIVRSRKVRIMSESTVVKTRVAGGKRPRLKK